MPCFEDRQPPEFWLDLGCEAEALQLTRPAYYALRYAHRPLGTPILRKRLGDGPLEA